MSLSFPRPIPAHPIAGGFLAVVRKAWQSHLHRRASRAALARLLAGGDDHLLQDVGLDRQAAHRLLGETMVVPHRAWDRWQG